MNRSTKKKNLTKTTEEDLYYDFFVPFSEYFDKANKLLTKKRNTLKMIYDKAYVPIGNTGSNCEESFDNEYEDIDQKIDYEKFEKPIEKELPSHSEENPPKDVNNVISLIEDKDKIDKLFTNPSKDEVQNNLDNPQSTNNVIPDDISKNETFSDVLKDFIKPSSDIIFKKVTIKEKEPDQDNDDHDHDIEKPNFFDYYSDPKKHMADFNKAKSVSTIKKPKVFIVIELSIRDFKPFHPEDIIESLKIKGITGIKSIEFGLIQNTGNFPGFAYMELSSEEVKKELLNTKSINSINYKNQVYTFSTRFRSLKELERCKIGTNQIPIHTRYYIGDLPLNFYCSDIMNMFYNIVLKSGPFNILFISLYYNNGVFNGKCHVNITNELNFHIQNLSNDTVSFKDKTFKMIRNSNVKLDYYK